MGIVNINVAFGLFSAIKIELITLNIKRLSPATSNKIKIGLAGKKSLPKIKQTISFAEPAANPIKGISQKTDRM